MVRRLPRMARRFHESRCHASPTTLRVDRRRRRSRHNGRRRHRNLSYAANRMWKRAAVLRAGSAVRNAVCTSHRERAGHPGYGPHVGRSCLAAAESDGYFIEVATKQCQLRAWACTVSCERYEIVLWHVWADCRRGPTEPGRADSGGYWRGARARPSAPRRRTDAAWLTRRFRSEDRPEPGRAATSSASPLRRWPRFVIV